MENLSPERKMTKAKTKLVLDHPFFGAIAMRLDYIEDNSYDTAYTNGDVIGYNANFIDSLSVEETTGLVAHEVMHLAMKHHLRRDSREMDVWNQATDYTINGILKDAGFKLPDGGLYDTSFAEQSAERIYATLHKLMPKKKNGPGKGDGSGKNCDQNNPPDQNNHQQPAPNQQQQPQPNGQNQGSAPNTGWGQVRDALAPNATEQEIQQANEDWDLTIANAYQGAKSIGNVPGNIARMVEAAKAKVIDWRDVLREFMEKTACRDDYTWMVPNRRYSSGEFILPSLADGEEIPQIVVGVDTSGSVDGDQLRRYAAEIGSILEDFACTFKVIYCDTNVRHVQDLSPEDMPFTLEAKGGGGTRLSPVFKYIKKEAVEAEAIIFFSDMYCDDFGVDPGIPVIWLNTGGEGGRNYARRHNVFGNIVDLKI